MIDERKRTEAGGFSLPEALVALVVFLIVLATVFTFFVEYGQNSNTQSSALDMQTSARIALDDIARTCQQAGYNIDRAPSDDPSTWQRDVVYAGSHAFAFNADLDTTIGPLDSSVTLTFPTGETYAGQGATAVTGGAETYVYTLDANGDNVISLADRTDSATGSYNPAADTTNAFDFALFKRVYGYNGTDYGGALVPVASGLYTNATSSIAYPDGTHPPPIFEYWLSEDIDRNGTLANTECVVGTCPPSTTRLPKLYLWGDTDGDGVLSDAEVVFIRDKPVGSAAWSKNPLVTSGAYNSTTLTAAFSPSSSTPYIVSVASVAKFNTGMYVQIDTGANTEYAVIDSVLASGNTISMNADLRKIHASGATVQVMPQTLLRAVRAVKIQFDAMAPVADTSSGVQAAGRAGRRGSNGRDYVERRFDKTVQLVNMTSDPLVTATNGSQECPLVTHAQCSGNDLTTVRAYFPSSAPTPINFFVQDVGNAAVSGVTMNFTKTNSFGSLSAASGSTDSSGLAQVGYTATAVGDSTVTADGSCTDQYFNTVHYTDTVLVKGTRLVATMTNDCLSTVSSRTAAPSTTFTVQAQDSGGVVVNSPVNLSLQFDPAYLPTTPDFTKLQATLYVGGTAVGSTDSTGAFTPWTGDTGGSGTLSGSVVLNKDTDGNGAKVNLVVSAPPDTCWPASGNLAQGVTYLKLNLASANPSGCTETSPCLIAAGAQAPQVVGTLSVNGTPIQGSTVTFSKTDFHPPPDTPAATSILAPSASVTTDSTGSAQVYVTNNGSAAITPANPLATTIDATTLGQGYCTTPSITPVSLRPKFLYSGSAPAGKCDADMQSGWMSGTKADVCMHILDPNVSGACPLRPTGIKFAMYTAAGALDASYTVNKIIGGTITSGATSGDCAAGGSSVSIFTNKCITPNGNLANNTRYDFKSDPSNNCNIPGTAANPGQYFALTDVKFNKNVPGTPVRLDVTLYYGCDNLCSTSPAVTETWSLMSP